MGNGASSYRRFLAGDDEGLYEIICEYRAGLILYLNSFVLKCTPNRGQNFATMDR